MKKQNCEEFIQECKQAAALKKQKEIDKFTEKIRPLLDEFPTLEIIDALNKTVSICGEIFTVPDMIDSPYLRPCSDKYYGIFNTKAEFGEHIIRKEEELKKTQNKPSFWKRFFL